MTKDTAKNIILAFIYPRDESTLTKKQLTSLENAVQLQREYEKEQNNEIVSEKAGDVSVTYAENTAKTFCGTKIAPKAYAILLSSGILSRWV